jgi:hypothetical protein
MNMPLPIKWGHFDDPYQVDLQRIYDELDGVVAIMAYVYLEQLKKNEPIVWSRLEKWANERGVMTWVKWR